MNKLMMTIVVLVFCGMPLMASAADSAAPASDASGAAPAATAKSQAQLEQELDEARAKLQEDAHKVADLSMQLNGADMAPYYRERENGEVYPRRGHLGVDITDGNVDGKQGGAVISNVSPGGPADKAGLQEGDVITGINGTSLKPTDDESAGGKLMTFMKEVKPGDVLSVAYTRDGKAATAKVTATGARDMVSINMPGFAHRAVLGIDISRDQSGNGVTLMGVTPDGPADKAGLRSGDLLVSLNGTALKQDGDRTSDQGVLAIMDKVRPGDKVKVDYTRDGKSATAVVTAESARDYAFSFRMPPMPPMPPMLPTMPSMSGYSMFFGGDRWSGMQLAPMSPGLSTYFGTDKGVLVLKTSKDSPLTLQEGDVILDIDGRDPGTPTHAMRILGTYGPGDTVKLDIMRKGKPVTLKVALPKSKDDSSSTAFNLTVQSNDDDAGGR